MDFNVAYLTRPLNGLLMIAMPVALGFLITRRFQLGWRLFFIGAATFILSQLGHIPFNYLVTALFQREVLPAPPPEWSAVFSAVFLGLSAGLWEEGMRYAVYRGWAKDARTWSKGVLFGTGHGGIEAILLGLLVLVTYVQMVALRGADLSAVVPADQLTLAQQQVASYWAYPWPVTLLGAVERLFSIPLHIACAVLVLQTFLRKQARWFWFAVLWHALADAAIVYLARMLPQGEVTTFFILEIPTGIAALVSLAIIFALRTPEPVEQVEAEPAAGIPPVMAYNLPVKEETLENLEETRFQ
jgi:uncharacterized membrane protein YhfC